jgi:bifunctional non-homologous end joining protein LigD
MVPELLTPICAEQAASYILDNRFWLQQKRDGVRLMVRKLGRQIEGWNKQGGAEAIDPALVSALLSINLENLILDGEFEKRSGYYCWDLLSADRNDLREHPYAVRLTALQAFAVCPMFQVLPSWTTSAEKEAKVFEFHRSGAEGVVFKDSGAHYRPGRAGQHFKLKFEKTATVRVRTVDPVRDRVSVEMLDGDKWCEVCGLKVPNGTLCPGQYLEIKYLYGTPDKRLVQPRFLAVREDVSEADCAFEQVQIGSKWCT